MQTLYTIGHSTHPIDVFIKLLQQHAITAVCDVRSQPYSRFNPQYNRETLKKSLQQQGIAYVYLGKGLGARSDNPDCYINGKVQYHLLAQQPLFSEGLNRLKNGMENYTIALMCAEKDPIQCHRTGLVTRQLRTEPMQIAHILADGSVESNQNFEQRLMKLHDIEPDLLTTPEQCVDRAYDVHSGQIAYINKKSK